MGWSKTDTSGMTDADRNDPENFDQSDQQDIAAAAAQSAGVNMGGYDFGEGFNPSNYSDEINSIVNSFMGTPDAASRTGMAIRQSFPSFNSPRAGLNRFANLYTQRMGPLQRATFNSLYDITSTNPGGINTLGYDTAKALGRLGIGTGKVSTNPNAGRLSGTVFSRKNAAGETILSQGGKSAGVDANTFYSGESSSTLPGGDMFDTYYDKYQYASPAERALNRQYDMYMNPYNKTGSMENPTSGIAQPGFNPDVDPASLRGQVRPGLQSGIFSDMSGTPTRFGPVATYDRNFSGTDNLAMMAFGSMGHLARALTNKVTGIAGGPLPQDALAPTPEMVAKGQTYGGFSRSLSQIPGQAIEGIKSLYNSITSAPVAPAQTPTSIGTTSSALNSWNAGRDAAKKQAQDDAVSSVMSQAQTNPRLANLSLEEKKRAINELAERNYQPYLDAMPDIDYVPGQRISTVSTTGGIDAATAKKADEIFGPSSLGYDFYTDPQAGGTYPSAMAGEQLAGLFGENPKAAGFRDLEGMIKSVIDGENLPDNQNMYGPGTPDLNDILNMYGMETVG